MNRSTFLASASFAALADTQARAATVPGGVHLVERASDFDDAAFAQLVGKPADVRQLWEAVAFHPGVFNNVKNALNGLRFGFGYDASRIAMVFCPHGPSSAYTYTDEIWDKYKIGDFYKLTDAKGAPVRRNAFLKPPAALGSTLDPDDEHSLFQDTSIQTLQSRGVVFLTCHTAVEEQARALVKGGAAPGGMTPSEVAQDILSHLIAGTHVVPAMVAAIAVLQQRFQYTYITLAA